MSIELTAGPSYGRAVLVSIGPRDGGTGMQWHTFNGEGLKITFNVKRNLESKPSECKCSIFNLSGNSRHWIQSEGLSIRIEAGYGSQLKTVFAGTIDAAFNAKPGVDWVTSIEATDSGRQYRDTVVNWSGAPGTTRRTVFGVLADRLGLALGYVPPIADTAYLTGIVLRGPVREKLHELCSELDLRYSMQNGTLQVVPRKGGTQQPAYSISRDTGLIGSPQMNRDEQGKATVKFKCLMNGAINPGRGIQLKSIVASGLYIVEEVSHVGDTHGGEFSTSVEGVQGYER